MGCWWLALGIAIAAGCNRDREKLPQENAAINGNANAVKVTVQPVTFRSVQRIVGVVGTLHGFEEIDLKAKVAGRIRKVTHDMADHVMPGEVLLEIEPTDYQLNVRQAQRALQVELAKLGLSELPGPKVDVLHIPAVVQAQERRDIARTRLERAEKLLARKAGTEEDLAERMSDLRVAQAECDNQVLVAKAGIAAIHVKQESLAIAQQQLLDTLVKVPVPSQPLLDGDQAATYAVTARSVSEGSYVMPGDELFQLVIEHPLKFRGTVPERKIGAVQLGQKAHVFTAAYAHPFEGEVTRINPAIDPQTRTFLVEVLVPNGKSELKPGGFAKTGILTSMDDRVATVPLEALVQFAGVTKVFLADVGHAKEVQVTLGVQETDWVEIMTPSIPAGAQVITSGQSAIADGTPIAVRGEPERAAESLAESAAVRAPAAPPVAPRVEAIP